MQCFTASLHGLIVNCFSFGGIVSLGVESYLLHVLTLAPEQVYLCVVSDGRNNVKYYTFCFVNMEVNDAHSRVVIGDCLGYANPDWSKSYNIFDLLPSNSAS